MKTRLAKIFAVVLTLVLVVGVMSTFVSAANPLDITDEAAGITTHIAESEFAGVNNNQVGNIAEVGRFTVKNQNRVVNYAQKTANGNSYLNFTRTVENNTNRYGDTYLDLNAIDATNRHTYANAEHTIDKYDFITVDVDISSDKWVSQDANGKWNILTDNFVSGARAAYSPSITMSMFNARCYKNGSSSTAWAVGTAAVASTITMKNEYGTWRVYARANTGGSPKGIISGTGVGTWTHLTALIDVSMLNFVGYNAAGEDVSLETTTDKVVDYFMCPNIKDAKVYVYFNGTIMAVNTGNQFIDGTNDTKVAYSTLFNAVTASDKFEAKVDAEGKYHPHISLDATRLQFGAGVTNEAFSMCYDNYTTTFYNKGYKAQNSANTKSIASLVPGSATKLTTLTDVVYKSGYASPANCAANPDIETYKAVTGQAIDNGNYVGSGWAKFSPVRYTDGGETRAASVAIGLDAAGTAASNGYARFYRDIETHAKILNSAENGGTADKDYYNDIVMGGYTNSSYSFAKYDYVTLDFDITADQWVDADGKLTSTYVEGATPSYPVGMAFNPFYRYKTATSAQANMGVLKLEIKQAADGSFYISNNKNTNTYTLTNNVGQWTHISFVFDVKDVTYTEIEANKFTSDINKTGKVYVYINGELYTTVNNFFTAYGTTANPIVGSNGLPYIGFDAMRIQSPTGQASTSVFNTRSHSYGLDNIAVQYHKSDSFAAQKADPTTPIYTNPNAVYTKDYNYISGYAAAIQTSHATNSDANGTASAATTTVKKFGYARLDWAIEAAEATDTVILGFDNEENITIDKEFGIDLNGHKLLWNSVATDNEEFDYADVQGYAIVDGKFTLVNGVDNEELFGEVYWYGTDGLSYTFELYTTGSTPVYKGETPASSRVEGNEWFVKAFAGYDIEALEGEYAALEFYPNVEFKADVEALFNLRTTTSFTSYFYVPWIEAEDSLTFTIDDVDYVVANVAVYDGSTISDATNLLNVHQSNKPDTAGYRFNTFYTDETTGQKYRIASSSPGAFDNRNHTYTVAFTVNGELYYETIVISMLDYFEAVVEGDLSDAEKSLIVHAANYMNLTMKASGKSELFTEFVTKYSQYLITTADNGAGFNALIASEAAKCDVSALTGLVGASFAVDNQNNPGYRPNFRFIAESGASETAPNYKVSVTIDLFENGSPAKTVGATWYKDGYFFLDDQIKLYWFSKTMTVTAGEAQGTYGLAAYIANVEASESGATAVSDVARALYAYSIASYNYKCGNTAMYSFTAAE